MAAANEYGHATKRVPPMDTVFQNEWNMVQVLKGSSSRRGWQIANDVLSFSLLEDISMQVAKIKLETIIRNLPELVDIEDLMYRLYLLEKIEAGEADIREGRVLSHEQAVERLSRKWQI